MGVLLDHNEVKERVEAIRDFQDAVHRALQEGRDWGAFNPKNPQRKTLLKPGAEVLKHLLGLTDKYTLMAGPLSPDGTSHEFLFQCTLITTEGEPVAEGIGYASTGEGFYRNADRYSAANSAAKIAKKRSLVDAILSAACLSGQFDQDLDEEDDSGRRGGVMPSQQGYGGSTRQLSANGKNCPTHSMTWRINRNGGEFHVLENGGFCNPHVGYRPLVDQAVRLSGVAVQDVNRICNERFRRSYTQLTADNCEALLLELTNIDLQGADSQPIEAV